MGNFYESLIETMQSGPCVVMTVLERSREKSVIAGAGGRISWKAVFL